MATGAESAFDAPDMGTAVLPGRNVLDIVAVRALSQRSDARGLLRFGTHLAVIAATGALVWLARPDWYLLVPAMIAEGFAIVTLFAAMHECVHRTAFASRWLNEVCGWIAGLLSFYNFHYYRHYHTWHHRYTQDRERDPELMTPKPRNYFEYVLEISGVTFWLPRLILFPQLALGRTQSFPFVPASARGKMAASSASQTAIYVVGIVSVACGYPFAWDYWFLPAILAQPLLRAITLAEHTGCSEDENGLTNTRTTLTLFPVRLLMWNMPFHAEHHLYPSIPFYQLPAAHRQLYEKLTHIAPSYVAANRTILRSLKHARSKVA